MVREEMKLQEYLNASTKSPGPPRGRGVETDWMDVEDLQLASGLLWIGDPQCSWSETQSDDGSIALPLGLYRLAAKGIDFGGCRLVSRVRALLTTVADDITLGSQIHETGTDSGRLGFADCRAIRAAFAATCDDDDDQFLRMIETGVVGHAGVLRPQDRGAGRLVYLRSGMGDGNYTIVQLVSQTHGLVGVECELIDAKLEW